MLIDLTVRGPDGDRDVRVDAPADTPFGVVRAELARAAGLPGGCAFFLDELELRDSSPVTALRTGSVVGVAPTPAVRATHPYSLRVTAGPAAGLVHPLHRGRVVIGRDETCDITLDDERISRRHVTLEVAGGRVVVLDHGSTNGSTVDGRPVPRTGTPLEPGGVLQLGDSALTVAAPAVRAAAVSVVDGAVLVHRPPRPPRAGAAEVVALPAPPERDRPGRVQWLAAAVPAVAAGGLAWFTGSTVFLLFGLLSPVLLLSTAFGDRWHGRRTLLRARARYRAERRAADRRLADALAVETEQRRAEFADPAVLALVAEAPGVDLSARRRPDDDWLAVRVGCGTAPARTQVREDGRERPGGVVHAVPVVADLRVRPLGLAGPSAVRAAMARWWVAQLAVHHSPVELSTIVLGPPERWSWVRWLPNVHLPDPGGERADVLAQLSADVEHRVRRAAAGGPTPAPAVVLVVDGPADAMVLDLVRRGAGVGVTAVWVVADPGALPGGCTTVVATADGRTRIVDGGPLGAVPDLVADTVTRDWAERVARNLAPLVDAQAGQDARIPDHCTLGDVLGLAAARPDEIAAGWAGDDGRADTVLGRTADGDVVVDLDADGPHALVAGTTGSGKSELLRTWVTGLCLRHPPDELSVLLIDYKGGAAFAECAELPHCAGLVTDLDPHLTVRALRSLDAEIRRRETLLRAAGAADLRAYRATRPSRPLARLVIVVDEFAVLAEELPDFLPGLVGVAQRGRSLGVHLILATQRPGSAVSPEIRANTSLRIALRVTESGESTDVVGTDDAAAFGPATPGRAVLRDGAGLQIFQSARAALSPPRTSVPRVTPLTGALRAAADDDADAGLAAIVVAVAAAASITGRSAAASPWLPPLPTSVDARTLPRDAFAVADIPERQGREPVHLALEPATSTLLLGTARAGRTTALASIALAAARTHGPGEVELHLVDPRGDLLALLDGLPHVATRLGAGELELLDTLLDRLSVASVRRRHLLLIDGWDLVLPALGDDTALGTEPLLATLLRAPGPVSVAVTGDRSLVAPRFSGAFDRRLALRLGDRGDYGALGVPARALPVAFPPGRGVRVEDGAEFQVAVPGLDRPPVGGQDADVAGTVRAAVERLIRTAAAGPADALRVRPLPAAVMLGDVGAPADDHPESTGRRLRLGVGGDGAWPVTLDPFAGSRRWLVCGPPRSGRSGVLCVVLAEAVRVGCPVLVAAPARSPVAELAGRLGVAFLEPGQVAIGGGAGIGAGGTLPPERALLLVDDTDAFVDTEVGDALVGWVRDPGSPLSVLATGRPDELALAYRGIAAEVRRSRSGIALRPGPVDGELFGVRLPRARGGDPPGRGWLVGDPAWSIGPTPAAALVRLQVAAAVVAPVAPVTPVAADLERLSPCGGNGVRCPTRTSP